VVLGVFDPISVSADGSLSTPSGVTVQYLGQSGHLRLTAPSSNNFIQLKWHKIQELDSTGDIVASVNNFASQTFTWSSPSETTVNGYNATSVTLTASLSVARGGSSGAAGSTNFAVTVYIFQTTATVQNGDQILSVPKDSVKFTVHVDHWPFMSSNNQLQFGVSLLSKGGNGGDGSIQSKDSQQQSIAFGPGSLDVANTAVVDGTNKAITVSTYKNGAATGVQWTFPYFNNSMDYDPTLSLTSSSSTGNNYAGLRTSFIMTTLVSIAMIIASAV